MVSFIVLYWGYSMQSPLNIGIRHLMPTIPFIYILAAGVWKKWVTRINLRPQAYRSAIALRARPAAALQNHSSYRIKYIFLVVLLALARP